jgi:exosortase
MSRQYVAFAALCLLASAILWKPLSAALARALHDEDSTQILLILPITIALIWSEWNSRDAKFPAVGWASLGLLLAGILTAGIARWWLVAPDLRVSAGMLALVLCWIAAFVLCFGVRAAQAAVFPLCFLLWMIPIPSFALIRITRWLQEGSALAASLLFSLFGVPNEREDILLYIPGLNIEVARECSSIRSSLMLVVTTMVLAYVLLRTPWRRALLVLVAIPLSFAKNGLRIFVIGTLGTKVDPGYLTGRFHHHGGFVFFLIALAVIFLLLWFLRRGEGEHGIHSATRH